MRPTRIAATAALNLLLFATASCGTSQPAGTAAPAPAASTSARPSPSPSPTPTYCPHGRLGSGECVGDTVPVATGLAGDATAYVVCPTILKVQQTTVIYDDPAAMQAIGEQAATSADPNFAQAGKLLAAEAKLAAAAEGSDDELNTSLRMGTAAISMATLCIKGGYRG